MNLRPYTLADKIACLAIFQGNTPQFFAVHEEAEFADFLDRQPCPYFVVEQMDEIVACGGYFVHEPKRIVGLTWGMVRRELHHHGIGKYLLLARLHEVCSRHEVDEHLLTVLMDTSQNSQGFFEKFGFVVTHVTENGYAPGLHRYELALRLHTEGCAEIAKSLP